MASTWCTECTTCKKAKVFDMLDVLNFDSILTFSMKQDSQYSQPLPVPERGLDLKTKIFVSVKATNLTDRY